MGELVWPPQAVVENRIPRNAQRLKDRGVQILGTAGFVVWKGAMPI